MRSRVECRASESTPRLPVDAARKVFSDSRTMAEPTEPRAAICFADVALDVEIWFPRSALPFRDYTTRRESASPAARPSCLSRTAWHKCAATQAACEPITWTVDFVAGPSSLQCRRRNERQAPGLPVRAADFHLLE